MTGYLQLADGRVVPVRDGIVIGRVAGCDCVIDDGKASRKHAKVVVEGGVVEIEDLDSSNGTLLNGKPVTRRVLRPGDEVQIGKTVIVYKDGTPPGAATKAPAPSAIALDDDNDLFGDTSPAVAAAPPAARTPPPPASLPVAPPPAPPPVPPAAAAPTRQTPAAPAAPAAPPPRQSVVEFADEIVEVRKAPAVEPKKGAAQAAGAPIVATGSRVLQFHKTSGSGGVLGDDLGQMSGSVRMLVYAGVLVLAAGIVYGIVVLVR